MQTDIRIKKHKYYQIRKKIDIEIFFIKGRFKVLTQHLISNKEGVDKWFIIQELN